MQSYFTGAAFKPLRPLTPSSFEAAFELPDRGSISASAGGDSSSREHIVDKSDKDEDVWASSVDEKASYELNEESHQERR